MNRRSPFATTWWGKAWLDALEHRARLDPNRLPRGRTYARHGRVFELRLNAGEIAALVTGSRRTPYRVRIRVRTFGPAEWDAVLDAITARAGHAAALLEGELDPGVVDDARAAGVELLPAAGDLHPRCSCPDWADPCKHAAAVCYLTAAALDADPFALLALRGKGRETVLAEVRRRRAGGATSVLPGAAATARLHDLMPAAQAWSRPLASLPTVPPVRAQPGRAAPWPVDPPADAPFIADGLRMLAADAAERGWRLAQADADGAIDADPGLDLARRASSLLGTPALALVARRAAVTEAELVSRALAWRHAGAGGVQMVDEAPWRPPPLAMAQGQDAARGLPGTPRVTDNRVTAGSVQLRLSRDGRWWRFRKRGSRWVLSAAPADDPDDLLVDADHR